MTDVPDFFEELPTASEWSQEEWDAFRNGVRTAKLLVDRVALSKPSPERETLEALSMTLDELMDGVDRRDEEER